MAVVRATLVAFTLMLSACGGEDLPEGEPTGTHHDSIKPGGEPVTFVNPTAVDVDNYAFANNGFVPEDQSIFDLPIINEFGGQNGARRPLKGEFAVSDAGDPSYTLMIDLPPAIAGFAPQLGFRYTGSTAIGGLRNGWSMIGYSEIAKCPATKRVDGFIGMVKGAAHENQRFCLDGEPLILVSGSAYGEDGSEYVTQKKSLARIKAFGATDSGPEYFELKAGDGVTKTFGQAKDATLKGRGVYAWKIDKIVDPSGNVIDYEYSGYRFPMFIYYQGKADGERSVRVYFAWERTEDHLINRDSRDPDSVVEKIATLGSPYSVGEELFPNGDRLAKIQIAVGYRNNLAYDESYEYHFEYDDHLLTNKKGLPPKSLLKKIFRCQSQTNAEGEPRCAKPVVFEWGYDYQLESKWDRCDLSTEKMWPGGAQYFSGEYVSSHPLTDDFRWGSGNYYSHVLADFNNDDNVDVAVIYTFADGGNSRMNAWVAYANGDGTFRDSGTRFSEIIGGSGIINHRLAGDVNNDGLADLIAMNASQGGWNAYVALNLGNGSFAAPVHHKLHSGDFGDHKAFRQITGDFNGDGNLDLMVFNLGNGFQGEVDVIFNPVPGLVAYVAYGNGDGSFSDGKGGELVSYKNLVRFDMRERGLFIADFNNDGITDIGSVFLNRSSNTFLDSYIGYETVVAFGSQEGGFLPAVVHQSPAVPGYTPDNYSQFHVADINGDGIMDMVTLMTDANFNALSFIGNGDGTFKLTNYWELNRNRGIGILSEEDWKNGDAEQGGCLTYGHEDIVADFNQDGYADIAISGNSYYLGRGDGTFLYQGGVLSKESDTVKATGGGSTIDSFPIEDTTYGVYAVDANKDGATDILEVVVDALGLKVGVIPNLVKPHQMKITSIDESGARHYAIEYDTIRNPNVYERTFEPDWPIRNLRDGKFVVRRVTTSNPTGGTHHFDYKYRDWLVDAEQKASDGFREVEVTDSRDETTTLKIFDQTYPRNGLLKEIKRTTKDGVLLWHESTSWDVEEHAYNAAAHTHTHHLVKRTGVLSRQYNPDGGLILETTTTYGEFDEFGIPWWTEMIRSDGYSVVTQNEYSHIGGWDSYFAGQIEFESETRTGRDLNDSVTRQTRYEYYPNGLLHRTIEEPNNPDLYLATEVEYYPNGMLKTKTVSGHEEATYPIEPQIESYVYTFVEPDLVNNRQYRTDIINAEDHKVSLFRSGLDHRVLKKIDENGLVTTFQYDSYGDLYLTTWPDKTKTQVARAQCDATCPELAIYRVFTLKDGSPTTVRYFNGDEKEIRVATQGLHGKPILQATYYDEFGRVTNSSVPYEIYEHPVRSRSTEYDILGRPVKVVTPEEGTAIIRYSALNGNGVKVEKEQQRQGVTRNSTIVTTQEQSANGDIRVVIDNERNNTFYFYDAFSNLARIEDAESNETLIDYDDRGRKIRITDPDSGALNLGLDALGRMRRQEDAKGQVITWEYDKLNRKTMKITREGTNFWIYDSAMNGVGKIAQEGSGAGYKKTYMYDKYGRSEVVNHAWSDYSVDLVTGYDALGRVSSTLVAEDLGIFYVYDHFGRLQKVANYDPEGDAPLGAMVYWEADKIYPDGRPESVLLNNGALQQTVEINRYTGRMMWASTGDELSADFTKLGFAFDSLGNLEWRADLAHGIKEAFTYDALNRLKNVYVNDELTDSHNYDAIGNITSKSDFGSRYEYGENGAGPRAVTSVTKSDGSIISYGYDANGNMISGGGRKIDYSSENLPLQVSTSTATISFLYDANARRVVRREGGVTTYYVNPAWHTGISFEREKKGADTVEKLYVAAGGLPIAMSERLNKGSVRHYFFQKDHLGSVVAIFNENNQIEESTNYKAFGHKRVINQIKQDDSPLISKRTTRGFTGHEHLDRVGLIHMNARLYDKDLGRFISPDTVIPSIANPQSINRYAYVYNNPLSLTDPSGNVPFGSSVYGLIDRMRASMVTETANAVVAAATKTKYDGVSHNAAVKSAVDQSPAVPSGGLSDSGGKLRAAPIAEAPAHDGIPINEVETEALNQGSLGGYYQSRLTRGDPYGVIGLSFWEPQNPNAKYRAMAAASKLNLLGGAIASGFITSADPMTQQMQIYDIGVALARAHADAVDRDYRDKLGDMHGVLDLHQITDFHHVVFAERGIPARYYGGTPIGGYKFEANIVNWVFPFYEGGDTHHASQ